MTELTPRLASELDAALADACLRAGFDHHDARLITYSSNAVYELSAPVVVRLCLHPDRVALTTRLVRAGAWLLEKDAPVASLVEDLAQPVHGHGYSATFWRTYDRSKDLRAADLATPLRIIHGLGAPDWLPRWDKFTYARTLLKHAHGIADRDHTWLSQAWDKVERDYLAAAPDMPHGVIHGDAHLANLLRAPDGTAALCDLDNVAYGPLDWDLTPSAVSALRFGPTSALAEFSDSYGRDVTRLPWWPTLRRIRELVMVTYIVTDLADRPSMAEQWQHRMATLRDALPDAPWDRYY